MAGIEFKGLDQLQRDFQELEKRIGTEVMIAAEDAAAEVFKAAILAAVPVSKPRQNFKSLPKHPSGQLRSSVTVIESKDRRKLTGQPRRGLFVGPEKKKGYYGYFIDKGYTAMGRAGRKARKATKTTHSQRGAAGGRKIPGTNWFSRAAQSAMAAAQKAYEAAFNSSLQKLVK